MNKVYDISSNIKTILLSEDANKPIKDIEEYKFNKFYINLNELYKKL